MLLVTQFVAMHSLLLGQFGLLLRRELQVAVSLQRQTNSTKCNNFNDCCRYCTCCG